MRGDCKCKGLEEILYRATSNAGYNVWHNEPIKRLDPIKVGVDFLRYRCVPGSKKIY